jgi:soluble lytic murein transglycosylase-like protein
MSANLSNRDTSFASVLSQIKKENGLDDESMALSSVEPESFAGVDYVAHDAATSSKNLLPFPTAAQKEAGNYKMGHTRIGGLNISIEHPAGSKRKPEHSPLRSHYGYLKRTEGADGEHLDVFLRPGTPEDYTGPVYVVDQSKQDGAFDEHKVLLGFDDEETARNGYLENYPKDWTGLGALRGFSSTSEFRNWLKTANMKQPAAAATAKRVSFDSSPPEEPGQDNFATTLSKIKKEMGLSDNAGPRREKLRGRRPFNPADKIRQLAPSYGLPVDLALRVMGQESGGQHYRKGGEVLTSEKNAKGLMQVLPETGRSMGFDVNDPEQNVLAGLDYLGQSYKRWNGDEALTLAGYHSGIEAAEKALRNPRGNPKTHNYIRSILGDDVYNSALSRYGIRSLQPGVFAQALQEIRGGTNPDVPPAPGAGGSFAEVLNSIKSELADNQPQIETSGADWSPDRPPTPENTQAMVNELLTNRHVTGMQGADEGTRSQEPERYIGYTPGVPLDNRPQPQQQSGEPEGYIGYTPGVPFDNRPQPEDPPPAQSQSKIRPWGAPSVDNVYARQNVTVTGLNVKNLSSELLKQKTLETMGFTPEDAKNEPFEFRIPMEQIAGRIQPGGFLDVQIPDEEYEYLSERARLSKLRAAPLPNADNEQIGGFTFVDPTGGRVMQGSGQTVAQNENQFLAPAQTSEQGGGGLFKADVLKQGVAERNASRQPDENMFASMGRDFAALAPGLADIATRPFQYLSTFISGLQRRVGAGIGSTFSEDSAKALDDYGMRHIFDAAAERFYTGKIRPGYEQPVAELSKLAVEHFGGDPESALPKFIAHTLELGTDPVNIAAMKPRATSAAGMEILGSSKDVLYRIRQSVRGFNGVQVPEALRVPTDNPQAGFLLFSSKKGKVDAPLEILGAMRKAGLLTGVKTQARNIGGNTMMQGLEELSRIPAAIVDLGISAVTRERTVQGFSIGAMARASKEAATKGVKDFIHIMKKGATPEQLAAQNLPDEIISGSAILDTYVNGSFRLQTGQDAIFKRFAITRSMEEQANLLARLEAKAGTIPKGQIAKRTDEIIQGVGVSPAQHTAMQARAVEDAAFATFTNEHALAKWIGDKIEGMPRGSVKRFLADQAIPFRRTPMNIINRILDYSPVGAAKGTFDAAKSLIKGTFDASSQRAFAQAMGRSTVGTATIYLGYKLAEAKLASGVTSEKDFDQRMWNDTTGRKEGALKIGNKWVEVSKYSPLGNLLALGASIYERAQEERPGEDGKFRKEGISAKNIWRSAGEIAEEQPLTRTAGSVKDLFSKPEKFGRDVLGSFVPSISSDIAGQFDSKERQATQWFEGIQKRLPGFRNQLPAKLDALGREIPSSANLNPFSVSSERMTRGLEELQRHEMMLALPSADAGESKADYQARIKKLGELRSTRLNAVVGAKAYQEGNDHFQRVALEEAKRTASEDLSNNRSVRRGDEQLILHNARVVVERDKFISGLKKQEFYKGYSNAQRKDFEEALKESFGHARAAHAKDVSIGEALDQARDDLADLLSDRAELIERARERAAKLR